MDIFSLYPNWIEGFEGSDLVFYDQDLSCLNYYKGHMDKIGGGRVGVGEVGGFSWSGVEGWGEKAYNCNWITIKIF